MVPLFVLIPIAAVLWRQRHRTTAKRLFVATLPRESASGRRARCFQAWLKKHQTTNLGVRSSNLFGRASFLHFPCDSHGIHTAMGQG